MDKDNEIDYEKAKRELESSINELRRLRGKKEIPYQDIPEESEPPFCYFCGKGKNQVLKMIEGPKGAYICNECVVICSEIIEDESDSGK